MNCRPPLDAASFKKSMMNGVLLCKYVTMPAPNTYCAQLVLNTECVFAMPSLCNRIASGTIDSRAINVNSTNAIAARENMVLFLNSAKSMGANLQGVTTDTLSIAHEVGAHICFVSTWWLFSWDFTIPPVAVSSV